VIPEQLAEEVVPDWPDEEFRLLRERSEQNRMHMPEATIPVCIGGACLMEGGNGTEILSPKRNAGCSLVLGSGA
jgi:hypothetical protein